MHIILPILGVNSEIWSFKGKHLSSDSRHEELSTIIADRHVVFLVLQRCMQMLYWRTATSSSLEQYAEKLPIYWSHWYYSSSQCLNLISGEAYHQLTGIVTDRQWNMRLLSGQETVSQASSFYHFIFISFVFLQIIRLLILKRNIFFLNCGLHGRIRPSKRTSRFTASVSGACSIYFHCFALKDCQSGNGRCCWSASKVLSISLKMGTDVCHYPYW